MEIQKKNSVTGVCNVVITMVSWLLSAVVIGVMIFTITSSGVLSGEGTTLFGYRFFIVKSDSMAATDFKTGDVVITKEVDPQSLQDGDIITFVSQNWGSFGEIVTHKIRRSILDPSGNPGFITYGTTTDCDDEVAVTYEYIIGKYCGKIPKIGTLFGFIKTAPGMLLCLFLPFLLVLLLHGGKLIWAFIRWRREQIGILEQKEAILNDMANALMALETQYQSQADQALLSEVRLITDMARSKLASNAEDPGNEWLNSNEAVEELMPNDSESDI